MNGYDIEYNEDLSSSMDSSAKECKREIEEYNSKMEKMPLN